MGLALLQNTRLVRVHRRSDQVRGTRQSRLDLPSHTLTDRNPTHEKTTRYPSLYLWPRTTLRMTRAVGEALFKHMRRDPHQEQMAFATARQAKTADGTLFILDEVILPDPPDLGEQSEVGVSPTPAYQRYVYQCAFRSRTSIVDFHTHPGAGVPVLSDIDELHALRNAQYITAKFPEPATLLMLVWDSNCDACDGVVYDRHREKFRQLDRVEILGRPNRIWTVGQPQTEPSLPASEAFDRQHRIRGWNQARLEEQRIGIIGLGGNGAPLLQTLLGIGAGRRGFIAISDHDLVEPSNLPRLPYAYEDHVGIPKVAAATQYAGRKSPSTPIYPFACRLNQQALQDRLKMATVLFCCVDNDAARKAANTISTRFSIPLIDLGCDIQVLGRESRRRGANPRRPAR